MLETYLKHVKTKLLATIYPPSATPLQGRFPDLSQVQLNVVKAGRDHHLKSNWEMLLRTPWT